MDNLTLPAPKAETLFALAPGPMRKRVKPPPDAADLKRQIREVESDIDDLEDDLEDARNTLERLETELRQLRKAGDEEQALTTSRMARHILDLPQVTGHLRELAQVVIEKGATESDAAIIQGYFEQREREAALSQSP